MDQQDQPIRKAAILVAALDSENAKILLGQLPAHQAESVRSLAASLEHVDLDEQHAVLEEFFHTQPTDNSADSAPVNVGVELDAGLAARIEATETDTDTYTPPSHAIGNPPPFRFLHNADPTSLVPFLKEEHPQTIAVVVTHMPHDRAAQLLSALPSDTQTEVLSRLANIDEMDAESLREIDQWLQSWMMDSKRDQQRREAGVDMVSAILAQVDIQDKRSMLANLRTRDQSLADRLEVIPPALPVAPVVSKITHREIRPLAFSDMAKLDDRTLAAVVRQAEPELTLLALAGASPAVIERFLCLFPQQDAQVLRQELTQLGPTRMSDIEAAQQELAHLATELRPQTSPHEKPMKLSVAA